MKAPNFSLAVALRHLTNNLLWSFFLFFLFYNNGNAQVMPGSLSFVSNGIDANGFSRMNIVWDGYELPANGPDNYTMTVTVNITSGSQRCVNTSLTNASKSGAFASQGSVSSSSNSVTFNSGSNIDALNLNPLQPLTLFTIFYVGTPGNNVTFSWSSGPAPQIAKINGTPQSWFIGLGSSSSPSFVSRTISGSIYKPSFTQDNCEDGSNAAVTEVTVNKTINATCSPVLVNSFITNDDDGDYSFTVNQNFDYTISPTKTA